MSLWHLNTDKRDYYHGKVVAGSDSTIAVADTLRSVRVFNAQTGQVLNTLTWPSNIRPLVSHSAAHSFLVLRPQASDCSSGIRSEYYSGGLADAGVLKWTTCVSGAPTSTINPIGFSDHDQSLWFWTNASGGGRDLFRLY